jgi:hypothetical protein
MSLSAFIIKLYVKITLLEGPKNKPNLIVPRSARSKLKKQSQFVFSQDEILLNLGSAE